MLHSIEWKEDLNTIAAVVARDTIFQLLLSLNEDPFHFKGSFVDRTQLEYERGYVCSGN